MIEPVFSREDLPDGTFGEYRKTHITRAIRMRGPFRCVTSEGNIASCDDGWLAVDSRGFPYPINAIEFERIYARAGSVPAGGLVALPDDLRQHG